MGRPCEPARSASASSQRDDDAIGPVSLMPQVPTAWWSERKIVLAHFVLAPGPLRMCSASRSNWGGAMSASA